MSKILLTGATGAVGSILLPLLVEKGHDVFCIVRSKKGQMPKDRLNIKTNGRAGHVTILEGNITEADAGLGNRVLSELAGNIDKVVHCAASTKFDKKCAEETRRVNVCGTKTMLDLASRIRTSEMHYVSTAYVAGDSELFTDTDCDKGQTLRNPYEESKLAAEKLVQQRCDSMGIPFSIYRLSVVVGDSESGVIPSFDGYYGLFKSILRMKYILERKRKKGAGLSPDIKLENGSLYIPLGLYCSSSSTINLIPSDWVASMLSQLIGMNASNQTFLLVHPDPPLFRWMVGTSLEHLNIKGFYYDPKDSPGEKSGQLKMLQAGLDEMLERYQPYMTHESRFISRNLETSLDSMYIKPPQITAELLGKLLDYAISVDWGKGCKNDKKNKGSIE